MLDKNKTTPRGVKITRAEADKIMINWWAEGRQSQKVVLNFAGKWFDVRKLSEAEVINFMSDLVGRPIKPEEIKNIKI